MLKKTCFLFLLAISQLALAQNVTKDFQNKSVSIFKNGTAFFVKSGTVKTTDKMYRMTENLPPALFATYWVLSPNGELNFLSSYVDTLEKSNTILANNFASILSANIGKLVKLQLKDQGDILEGKIVDIPNKKELEKEHQPMNSYTATTLTIKTSNRWITFSVNNVERVEFLEEPNQTYTIPNKEIKPVLQVDFTSNKKEQPLDMMYLSNGLSWTPIYLIELMSDDKARLTLRAEVVNEIEDIVDTEVNFVVGVPNFSDANRLSPLIDFTKLGFNNNAYANVQQISNMNFSQMRNEIAYDIQGDVSADWAVNNSGLDGSAEEDLYFYTLKNMSLKKGGRGHYPVFTSDINISHIYECNLPPNNNNKNTYTQEYLFSVNPNHVIHSIKINNDTKYPFTTGPALVVKQQGDTKPISQDKLNYTSVGGHSFVKLTESPDIQISQAEKAIATEERAKKGNRNGDYYYDLITVEGQVKIKNYKEKNIDLNIRRTITGNLQQSNVKWLTAERITNSNDSNKVTDVCWETNVKAGEELKIVYTYQIYVMH